MRRNLGLLLAGLVTLLLVSEALGAPPGIPVGGRGGPPEDPGPPHEAFTIGGSVTGLGPGVTSTLALHVENPFAFAIVVETLEISVGDASAGCPASNLDVGRAQLPVEVDPRATGSIEVLVSLPVDADDGCQGATFPLEYEVTAAKAR